MNIDTLRGIFPTGYIGMNGKQFAVNTATNSTTLATSTDYVTWTLTSAGTSAASTNQAETLTELGLAEEAAAGVVTPGVAAASKAVVLGVNKEIATITSATITTLTSTTANVTTVNATNLVTTTTSTTTLGVGTKSGGTVTVVENGEGTIHKTVMTLTATPVVLTDDPGNGAYAALKLYDFPAGNIVSMGASINADLTLTAAETWWVDDKGGDVGLGTVATAVGTALTGTTQNIIASAAITAAAQVAPIDAQSTGVGTSGVAGGTDADIVLNIRIDDDILHFPDLAVNGTFTTDANWTKGTGWTIDAADSNVAECDGSQEAVSDLSAATNALIFSGVSYSVTYTTTRSAGTITPVLGGTLGTARSTANTFTETIVAGAGGVLLFRADADFVGTLDDVIITPLTGSGTVTGTVTVVWINAGDY